MPSWWIDELYYAGQEHLDPDYVAGYDRKTQFDASDDVAVLRAHGLAPTSTVLDLGAGTGTFAMAVAPHCGQVIAIDVSPAMVSALRSTVARAEIANISVVEGGFLSYAHQGEPVDFVYSRNALHQLPDFWKALALQRLSAMLRPGGILRLRDLVFDFDPSAAHERIAEWLSDAVEDPRTGWTAEELAEHVRSEFSTFSWLLEPILERTGFEILDRHFRRYAYGAYTCRRT